MDKVLHLAKPLCGPYVLLPADDQDKGDDVGVHGDNDLEA